MSTTEKPACICGGERGPSGVCTNCGSSLPPARDSKSFDLISPIGTRITGTLERLYARACTTGFHLDENGAITPDYEGSTEEFWEGQETVEDALTGGIVVLDEQGEEFGTHECLAVDVTQGEDEPSPDAILEAWTATYGAKADAEGWSLFNDGEIQRDDASAVFADDAEAIAFVIAAAAGGNLGARHALWIVRKFHPEQVPAEVAA